MSIFTWNRYTIITSKLYNFLRFVEILELKSEFIIGKRPFYNFEDSLVRKKALQKVNKRYLLSWGGMIRRLESR